MTDLYNHLTLARETFIQGVSRISNFWGFPKAMGAIYGAIYLSPEPLCLDDIVVQVNVTKGAVSTNVRQLERLGMIHKHLVIGDRKDYYSAETDFWKIIKGILREREKTEFDAALSTVSQSLALVEEAELEAEQAQLAEFYRQRLGAIQSFFKSLDQLVAMLLALDEFRIHAIQKLLRGSNQK